jgi:hypothetical protein
MLRSIRLMAAVAALVAFNVIAIVTISSVGPPTPTWVFLAWFVGDVAIGLAALALTESR